MVKLSVLPEQNNLDTLPTGVRRLDLKTGYTCCNDCLFCVVAEKRPLGDKTTKRICQELKSSFKEGKTEVVFTGGEVTLREDIFELVSCARTIGYREIQVQTNGRRFSSLDFCKKMLCAGMNVFAPALHGPTATIHDSLTRAPGSWRQTVLGIHNMTRLGIRTLTNTVVTKQNYRFLPDVARLLIRLRVMQFQFAFVHIQGNALRNFRTVVPRMTDAAPFIKKGLDVGLRAGIRVMAEAIPFCILPGYEEYCSEKYIPAAQIKELSAQVENFDWVRKNEAKIKFSQCLRCLHYQKCEGPWREYPELFGEAEFQPIFN